MAWTCHRVLTNSPISVKNRNAEKQNIFSIISPIAIAIVYFCLYTAVPILPFLLRVWPICMCIIHSIGTKAAENRSASLSCVLPSTTIGAIWGRDIELPYRALFNAFLLMFMHF